MASKLLPSRMRDAVLVYYAYCRQSDDAIDESSQPRQALARLSLELQAIFAGEPANDLVSRQLSRLVRSQGLSLAPFVGLLEGFAWDCEKKEYNTLEELEEYCARVAATVGISMTEMMGPRDPSILARAADLGVAMQLTNIARDIGSDARAQRLYLPRNWMREAGLNPEQWMQQPVFSPDIAAFVQSLLQRADTLYQRCESGIAALPKDCRASIFAARLIYSDIGRMLKKQAWDSVSQRVYVRRPRKLLLLAQAWLFPPQAQDALHEPALPSTKWLCENPAANGAGLGGGSIEVGA